MRAPRLFHCAHALFGIMLWLFLVCFIFVIHVGFSDFSYISSVSAAFVQDLRLHSSQPTFQKQFCILYFVSMCHILSKTNIAYLVLQDNDLSRWEICFECTSHVFHFGKSKEQNVNFLELSDNLTIHFQICMLCFTYSTLGFKRFPRNRWRLKWSDTFLDYYCQPYGNPKGKLLALSLIKFNIYLHSNRLWL